MRFLARLHKGDSKATEGPFGGDESIDERKLGGMGRLVEVESGGESFELGGCLT